MYHISVIQVRSNKGLGNSHQKFLGKYLQSLVMSPRPLLALRTISSTWKSKANLLSNNKAKLNVKSFTASCREVIKING